ncbi:MAG: ABC transporter permease [Oscillospiraceae bacterium]|jgi:peptide/nickel transport system permease protein|nr:ABC transporter permease [Oscillospiraceae bacterium]
MLSYILKRIFFIVPVLLGVSFIVFLIMRVFSPDPSIGESGAGKYATQEQRMAWREERGLNAPIPLQFLSFVGGAITGDLGESYKTKIPVTEEIFARFPATVEIALTSMLIASFFGILMGVISSVKRNSIVDRMVMLLSSLGTSVPVFWIAIMATIFFSGDLHLLPSGDIMNQCLVVDTITGFYSVDTLLTGNFDAFLDFIRHLILPAFTLSLHSMSVIARITRSSMIDTLAQDYIRTARAKGLGEREVVLNHALRNALIPVVTVIGLQLGTLFGGAVLVETVFSWPGIGGYVVESVLNSDFPVVQAVVLLVAVVFTLTNLIMDIIYAALNPKIKFTKEGTS